MCPRSSLRHAVDACVYRVYACATGRDLDHPFLAPILKSLPNDVEFKGEEGGVVVNLQDNGQDLSFSAVELVAMVLSSAQVIWVMQFGWTVPFPRGGLECVEWMIRHSGARRGGKELTVIGLWGFRCTKKGGCCG